MKILEVRFKNINSLAGEWIIDFRHPDYLSNPLFAITGETGSGKTTILDAICFALYAKTPRQASLGNKNELMTRGTAECFAQVTFSTKDGEYTSRVSQNTARNVVDAKLQNMQYSFIDDKAQIDLVNNKKKVFDAMVEEKTGLKYDQFSKAVLLAQGSFGAFMKGKASERAEILEKLSGTEIYTEISRCVFERTKAKNAEIETLKAELQGYELLSDVQIDEIKQRESELEAQQKKASDEIATLDALLKWCEEMAKSRAKRDALKEERRIATKDNEDFAPLRVKMQMAIRANSVKDKLSHARNLRVKCDKNAQELENLSKFIEKQRMECLELSALATANEERLNEAKATKERDEPRLKKMRELDQCVRMEWQECQKIESDLKTHFGTVKSLQAKCEALEQEEKAIQNKIEKVAKEFEKYPNYDAFFVHYSGILERLSQCAAKLKEGKDKRLALDQSEKNLAECQKVLDEANGRLEASAKAFSEVKNALKKLEVEKESAFGDVTSSDFDDELSQCQEEINTYQSVNRLESERAKLKEGAPCPLCGATHHPGISMAHVNAQLESLSQKLKAIKARRSAFDKISKAILQQTEEAHRLELNNEREAFGCRSAKQSVETAKDSVEKIQKERDELLQQYQCQIDAIKAIYQTHGMAYAEIQIKSSDIEGVKGQIQALYKKLQDSKSNQEILKQNVIENRSQMESCKAQCAAVEAQCREEEQKLAARKADWAKYGGQRAALGKESADDLEKTNRDRVEKAEVQWNASQERLKLREAEVSKGEGNIEALKKESAQLHAEREEASHILRLETEKLGFSSELVLEQAMMEESELQKLQERERMLADALRAAETKLDEAEKACRELEANPQTDKDKASLETERGEWTALRDDCIAKMATYQNLLKQNAEKQQKVAEKVANIEKKQVELDRYKKLDDLIGSADGKKFRNYVQCLTFKQLLTLANRHLKKFSDRYVLDNREIHYEEESDENVNALEEGEEGSDVEKKPKKGGGGKNAHERKNSDMPSLDFYVVDSYQGGIVRPTTNLSGGETFIVSLALALGLADMASHNVQIDTLFLDEGFGTLDAQTLETVLTSLANLSMNKNKSIGIITHVDGESLKKVITNHIEATKIGSTGRSMLTGPGVKHMEGRMGKEGKSKEGTKTRKSRAKKSSDL